ncbi:hypothetical protein DICPUDRAFT_93273 [Dictyostelium purpureum]|uniref:ApaG domain-containing protein n=1 Tax=Dictyostelium purpureum TaxID=5786 RepID=F1A4X9_DICPU|nr:uncharacterized protein DICPUDRAFT_93273 [Dictyostelium purpureum]EGC28751.1 hypothetical protein DICPUDRAFT_93273 [Dictyostelium purpureum]|eukprot:XP_003294719.1 hypothetical protein DICPUDRAFT_93273 [Dictyostelium purpureum]
MDKNEDPNKSCQLIRRHWTITTSKGSIFTDGPGVIGLFPIITPGVKFEYCSKCELDDSLEYSTVVGTMNGYLSFSRLSNRDEIITAIVPLFFLTINQQ